MLGIQPKLRISEPGDTYEQEADRLADAVVSIPESHSHSNLRKREEGTSGTLASYGGGSAFVMRKPEHAVVPLQKEDEEKEPLQRKALGGAAGLGGRCADCDAKKLLGVQPRLTVGEPDDAYEREADRVAQQVLAGRPGYVGGIAPLAIRSYAPRPTQGTETPPASLDAALATVGRPLEPGLRLDMERRFGVEFGRVRIHENPAAARAIQARAFTVGSHIVFGGDEYRSHSGAGRRLLAHELTHVLQQRRAVVDARFVEPAGSSAEREADAISTKVASGGHAGAVTAVPWGITRDVGWAGRGPIPDAYGMGYNTILSRSGAAAESAVRDLASLERSDMSVDTAKFVTLPSARRSAILALQPHAAGTACEAWFAALQAAQRTAGPDPGFGSVSAIVDNVRACDGGLGLYDLARKANGNRDPIVQAGPPAPFRGDTDATTGTIRISTSFNLCAATQTLVQELSNLTRAKDVVTVSTEAAAGDVSRADFIRRIERIEYETGVRNVLSAFDACKIRWGCPRGATSEKEWARNVRGFDDYFANLLSNTHKEHYGTFWDTHYRAAYQQKHPPAGGHP